MQNSRISFLFAFATLSLGIIHFHTIPASAAERQGGLAIGVPLENVVQIDDGAVHVLHATSDGLIAEGNQLWSQNSPGIAGTPEASDAFGISLAAGDFNRDGRTDLAIGAEGEAIGAILNAGAVNVIYGTEDGLASPNNQLWNQGSNGILGTSDPSDFWGAALAVGDFNSDGYDDLAIGGDGVNVGIAPNAGAVTIIYGSPAGLASSGNQVWTQDTDGIDDAAEPGDNFGRALAAGDFNNDGFDDLAIGAHNEDVGAIDSAGAVSVIYGSDSGLAAAGSQFWTQDSTDILGGAEDGDNFGRQLTTGDFNNDGFADLAIGVAREDIIAIVDAGAVNIIYGSENGLAAVNNQLWDQNTPGILGEAEADDNFGVSLATGDFNRDGFSDLAIGVDNEDIGAVLDAGAVNVIYGSGTGLVADGNQLWSQDTNGIAGISEENDRFGEALTAGDLNHDGIADLVIGVPDETVDIIDNAGAINVIYGSDTGLTAANNQLWTQDSAGILGTAETNDNFGASLAYIPRDTYFPWIIFQPSFLREQPTP